jgi:hypothetical protein
VLAWRKGCDAVLWWLVEACCHVHHGLDNTTVRWCAQESSAATPLRASEPLLLDARACEGRACTRAACASHRRSSLRVASQVFYHSFTASVIDSVLLPHHHYSSYKCAHAPAQMPAHTTR